ncbi:MAG TPA: 16S rRNA (cytidine(1402)-2'-O)-methyltransferase [Candidatus Paceibacterota bacterium]
MTKLSVVATPIGNLEDMTLRALRTLKEADVIACEDTRMTGKLLAHFDIHTPTVAFHSQSGERGFEKIIGLLEEGKHVALVSDAGTPGVSDPGQELVSRVREHFADEVMIEAIAGPSALAAALSVCGLRASSFTFYGFLPLKKGRESLFDAIASDGRASIFYESSHRIVKALESLAQRLPEERRIGVFRELTKLHEEAIVGSAADVLARIVADSNKQRGEFVIIVESTH